MSKTSLEYLEKYVLFTKAKVFDALISKVNRDRYNMVDVPSGSCFFFTSAGYQCNVLKNLKV